MAKPSGQVDGSLPRSHSLVSRVTGNHVGPSRGSSNLALGASITNQQSRREFEPDENWTLLSNTTVLVVGSNRPRDALYSRT